MPMTMVINILYFAKKQFTREIGTYKIQVPTLTSKMPLIKIK